MTERQGEHSDDQASPAGLAVARCAATPRHPTR